MRSHSPLGELAPRDVVSRAVHAETASGEDRVYLSLAHLDPAFVRRRFSTIEKLCADSGFDLAADRIPVAPAAHYTIGRSENRAFGGDEPRGALRLRGGLEHGSARGQQAREQLPSRMPGVREKVRRRGRGGGVFGAGWRGLQGIRPGRLRRRPRGFSRRRQGGRSSRHEQAPGNSEGRRRHEGVSRRTRGAFGARPRDFRLVRLQARRHGGRLFPRRAGGPREKGVAGGAHEVRLPGGGRAVRKTHSFSEKNPGAGGGDG